MLRTVARTRLAETMNGGCNLKRSEGLYREALALCRQAGHVRTEAQILQSLADIARRQCRNDEAMALINQAIEIFERIGDRSGEGIARRCRGLLLHQMGKFYAEQAKAELRRHIRIALDLDHPLEVAWALMGLAAILRDEFTTACIACLRTAQSIHERIGHENWSRGERELTKLKEHGCFLDGDWNNMISSVANDPCVALGNSSGAASDEWCQFFRRWSLPPFASSGSVAASNQPPNFAV
jgi:tetratricopeptide (TPR) repeat protein